MNPLVSIIIPVYNGSNYLAEAIDSALAQTYKNIEIIVINDGSKDNGATEKVALSYGEKIRYITKPNGGVSSALNIGIKEMKGEYFSWLSHDDLYKPEKIKHEVSLIKTKKDIVLCSGSLMDADGKPIKHYTKTVDKTVNGRELFKLSLHGYALNGLGFLIPRVVFDTVGLFDEEMRYLQDLDMWLRMMWYDYTFVCCKDLLVVSRIHKEQTTNTAANLYGPDSKKLARKHLEGIQKFQVKEREELMKLYLLYFERGGHREAASQVKALLRNNGNNYNYAVKIFYYRSIGRAKDWARNVRNVVYKIMDRRS